MDKLKRIGIAISLGIAIIGGVWLASPSKAAKCSEFNVVSCGTYNIYSVREAYNRTDVRSIYNHAGVTDSMVNNAAPKTGTVYRDGRIVVDGRVVGTAARTFQAKAGTLQHSPEGMVNYGGTMYYQYPISHSFVNRNGTVLVESEEIFAWFDNNGKFVAGVIKSCGNPIWTYNPTPPPAKPSLTCDALQKTEVSRDTFKFSTKATAKDGASVTSYTYDFGDGTTQTTTSSEIQHTYAKPGNYKVTVTVNGKEGSDVQKTSQGCQTQITVKPEPEMQVCRLSDKKYPVTIKESEFDEKKYSKNPNDCKEVPEDLDVCIIESKQIKKIKKEEFDESKHTTDLSRCKETPEEIEVCVIETKQIKRIKKEELNKEIHTTDLSKCKEKPVTPPETPSTPPETPSTPPKTPETPTPGELPKTGTTNIVMSALGLGGLTTAIIAYAVSRRQM